MYFEDDSFHFHTTLKKLPNNILFEKISGHTVDSNIYGNSIRYFHNAQDILNKCLEKNVTEIAIEGYSYGHANSSLSPGRVFDIAEATGIVKCLLIQNNISIKIFPPKQIKKFATGKGNASKILMIEKYFELNPNSILLELIKKIGDSKKYESPINDLVDSYWIYKLFIS
jgi:hypothetical protein